MEPAETLFLAAMKIRGNLKLRTFWELSWNSYVGIVILNWSLKLKLSSISAVLGSCCYLTETVIGMQISVKMILLLDLIGNNLQNSFQNEIIHVCGPTVKNHY